MNRTGEGFLLWQDALETHVRTLAGDIGERHLWQPDRLEAAAAYIEASLSDYGYAVAAQHYPVKGRTARNLEVEIRGGSAPAEIVLAGAHYDTVPGCPGGDDNASGVAALLELARQMNGRRLARTLRLVAFVNEEPPFFQSPEMGSHVYARRCRQRGERIAAMFSLESLGYFSTVPGSQAFPLAPLRLLYPHTGDFLAFVANLPSHRLLCRSLAAFRRWTSFPARGMVAPEALPGIGWSDQWPFWRCGYPAVMITDTAPFRYPHYHTPLDRPDQVRFPELARVTSGLAGMLADLAGAGEK